MVARELVSTAGSGTSTLTFAMTVPRGASVASPTFRGTNGQPGEVILLPARADLKDRLGNAVTPIGGDCGETYRDARGNRVVVIGAHYDRLKKMTATGEVDLVLTAAELEGVLTAERDVFSPAQPEAYWWDYQNPDYRPALYDVDVYRVAYRSTIPSRATAPRSPTGWSRFRRGYRANCRSSPVSMARCF